MTATPMSSPIKLVWDRESSGAATSRLEVGDNSDPNRLMTVREAAASIRVSEDTIRWWMRKGYIPFVPVGAFKMVRKADLYSKDAADGMPTARPRDDKDYDGDPHGDQTLHTAADTRQPAPGAAAPTPEAKAKPDPQRPGGPGPGERHKGRR